VKGLADTSLFIASETDRALDTAALPEELAVSVITIGELEAGVLAARDLDTRHRRLDTLGQARRLAPLPIDETVARHWARLRVLLRDRAQRMPVNDSWIAATALALDVPVVTQDSDYDVELDDLTVIKV
jgi:predicted nucleic acid-binding protein